MRRPSVRLPRIAMSATFVAFASVVACGDDDPTTPSAAIASVVVSLPSGTVASLGETVLATATVTDVNGNIVTSTVTWTTSDAAVATVAAGTVTAVGNGTATITASAGGQSGSAMITIEQVAAGVSVLPADGVIKAASQLTGAVVDARGNAMEGSALTWTSITPGILTVNLSGDLTPVSTGVGRIQVEADGFMATAIVRTVWNVQQLSDLFPLFEYTNVQGPRAAFSDEDQANADERGQILDQIWTYMTTLLPNSGLVNTEVFFSTWGEIWTEFTPWCSGQLIEPTTDATNWTHCSGAKSQHFFMVENEPSDQFLIMRFIARQFVLNSNFDSGTFGWFVEGYTQWLSAGSFQGTDVVVAGPRAVSKSDFDASDAGGTLASLAELVVMPAAQFYANPQNDRSVAQRMGQSVMFFDYLHNSHPTVIPGLMAMITSSPGAGVINQQIIDFITTTTGMTVAELDAAYLAHARAL